MTHSFDPGRRAILRYGAWAATLPGLARIDRALGRGAPAPVAGPLTELDHRQVQLAPGPLATQGEQNHRLLMGMDEDAMLRPFRMREQLPAPGRELGGWYATDAFAPGANFGQWTGALARYARISGDPATQAKLQRLWRGYAATVEAQGRFYRHNRFPAYTYDKLVGGLVDACQYTGDTDALAILRRTNQAALPYLPPRAIPRNEHAQPGEDFSQHAWDESYTLPENQFLAFRLTGDPLHRTLGERFLYHDFFGALARGDNALPGKHAYSHVNALSSAAQAYLTLGDRRHLRATAHGFDFVDAQSFATGGWGPDEHFVAPGSGKLGVSLVGEHKSFETPCGSYAHFKLTRYLLRITRDPRYGDSMERVLYNTVLGALPLEPDGHAFYYSDYTRNAQKGFHPDRWPCCSATLPLVAADHRLNIAFAERGGLYMNLYVPSTLTLRPAGTDVRLTTRTRYPYASAIAMDVQTSVPQTFALHLRIPAWAAGASLRINGKAVDTQVIPGRFASVQRQWRSGDRIELDLPLRLRLSPVDAEHPDTVALLAGPLVAMRLLDREPATPLERAAWLDARTTAYAPTQWRVPADPAIRLRAFADLGQERYSVYQDVRAG